MTEVENKELYRRFIQTIFNEGRLERVSEFLAPSYSIKDPPPGTAEGAEGVKQVVSMFRDAFPDLEITLDEVIAEGNAVAASSTLRGTHRGEFLGVSPTGRTVSMKSLTLVHIEDGRLTDSLVKNDVTSLLRQIGAGPG